MKGLSQPAKDFGFCRVGRKNSNVRRCQEARSGPSPCIAGAHLGSPWSHIRGEAPGFQAAELAWYLCSAPFQPSHQRATQAAFSLDRLFHTLPFSPWSLHSLTQNHCDYLSGAKHSQPPPGHCRSLSPLYPFSGRNVCSEASPPPKPTAWAPTWSLRSVSTTGLPTAGRRRPSGRSWPWTPTAPTRRTA